MDLIPYAEGGTTKYSAAIRLSLFLGLCEQLTELYTERFRNPLRDVDRNIANAPLDLAHRRAVKLRFLGKRFLRELSTTPDPSNCCTETFPERLHAHDSGRARADILQPPP
jgi:hypothetical protein